MTDTDGLNVTEAADFLGVSRTTVYAMLKADTIPHYRAGTQPRFSRTALVIWQGGAPLAAILARVARLAAAVEPAPTTAPTAPAHRLTPKHISGRRHPTTGRPTLVPTSGVFADDRP